MRGAKYKFTHGFQGDMGYTLEAGYLYHLHEGGINNQPKVYPVSPRNHELTIERNYGLSTEEPWVNHFVAKETPIKLKIV